MGGNIAVHMATRAVLLPADCWPIGHVRWRASTAHTALLVSISLRCDPCQQYSPLIYKQAAEDIRILAENARNHSGLSHKVRQILVEGSSQGRFYSLEEVADRLHLSVRTLTRRLHDESASFRDIQCESRLELAKQQLRHSRLPVKAICSNAGFTNLSAFSRAFRKYSQVSPSEYRESHSDIVANVAAHALKAEAENLAPAFIANPH